MMEKLEDLQAAFQDRMMGKGNTIDAILGNGGPFMRVYEHAYVARQQEIISEQMPALQALLGDEQFAAMTEQYVQDNPPTRRSARWIGEHLPTWLRRHGAWCELPALADMAAFEWALAHAFDAQDEEPIAMDDLASVPPEAWPVLTFVTHPALSLIELGHDVAPFQRAIADEMEPSEAPVALDARTTFAVWRNLESMIVQYRPLEPDESVALKAASTGASFADICEDLAIVHGEEAPLHAAGYLRGWVEAGWMTDVQAIGINWTMRRPA